MDNIKRNIPIRQYKLAQPLVLAFNIHLSHYNAFGNSQYQRLYDILTNPKGANLDKRSVYLLPNVTNLDTSIDIRAGLLTKNLQRLLGKIGAPSCHLVGHSFTGIDARAAISMYGADQMVNSLTTICTPHLGMKVIDRA